MSVGDTLVVFQPEHHRPPASGYATLDVRNGHLVLDFDDSTDETAFFSGIVPRHYSGEGMAIVLSWAATSATSGNVRWGVAFERHEQATDDLDSDSFATTKEVTAMTASTSGALKQSEIAFSSAEIDGLVAGEHFRLKVTRNADDASDTLVGDSELLAVEMKES